MFKPYQLAKLSTPNSERPRVVEIISMPTPSGTIMVRMVPGDPTTIREESLDLLSEYKGRARYCHIASVITRLGFPEDMLRYDCAALCDATLNESDLHTEKETLIYSVSERKSPHWTYARWHSFLAGVRHCRTINLRNG